MENTNLSPYRWAKQEFGQADLGHGSRTARAVSMAAEAAKHPSGKISAVFKNPAQRQGAYCFVQNEQVDANKLVQSMSESCVSRTQKHSHVFIAVDGTSLSITDRKKDKDFGPIGARSQHGRGVKVIDAIGISPTGCPLGVTALETWIRPKKKAKKSHKARKVKEKETQRWLDAIEHSCNSFERLQSSTKLWFLLDREADSWPVLHKLNDTGQWFTVRSNHNRALIKEKKYLHDQLHKQRCFGHMYANIPGGPERKARQAKFSVRVLTTTLRLVDDWTKICRPLEVNAVMIHEVGTTPKDEEPLHWVLLTNHPVCCMQDVEEVVRGYSYRWRIEDFHKTWKSGHCNVEDTQLHYFSYVNRWATILASVAMRTERLKHLSRTEPDLPASEEFDDVEILALKYLKNKNKKRNETIPKGMPSIAEATLWVAELGGYTGKSSGGPPGSTTIGRGLEYLQNYAEAFNFFVKHEGFVPKID